MDWAGFVLACVHIGAPLLRALLLFAGMWTLEQPITHTTCYHHLPSPHTDSLYLLILVTLLVTTLILATLLVV
jgi:hypothetical protein